MKRYTSYIVAAIIAVSAAAAVLHEYYKPKARNCKYGNPASEKLVRECRYYKTEQEVLTVRLYEGRSSERGTTWYSVTFERPGTTETQIFISAGSHIVDSLGLSEKEIKLICGKGCITIPVDDMESRFEVPLIYYNGREIKENGFLSDKI